MKAQTQTTGFSSNLRLFLVIVGAIVAGGIILFVAKDAWNSHQASVAREKAEMAVAEEARQKEIVTELQDLWRNTIGPVGIEGFENFGFSWLSIGEKPNLPNDKVMLQWANWVAKNPGFCIKLHPSQTQPIAGCDFYKDGVWSYSLSPETAARQLKEDANKYNELADNVACSALTANNLPCKLNNKGDPVQTSEQKVTTGDDGQFYFKD